VEGVKQLHLAEGFKIPLEAVEDVVAILGRRGRGKTTTAAVIVEELHAAGARFCVADPTDVWWGLKSSRDGKTAGIPCVVMGGPHGDVPLAAESGKVIADFVAEQAATEGGLSCVLELKSFTQGELVRFMTAFLEGLYHRNSHPLHLVLDEADQFAPQRPMPGEQAMLGAAQRVTKMGRAKGLHPLLITQRPATLSKNVLTQAGLLVAHALTGPQDQRAVDEWIRANAEEGPRAEFLAALPGLPRGTAYFWSPDLPLFRRVDVRDRRTWDSSATPKQETALKPKALAEVDLEALKTRIASTIERAKAEDPRELRKKIADLERQLKAKPAAAPAALPAPKVKIVEKPILKDRDTRRLAAVAKILERKADGVEEAARVVRSAQQDLAAILSKLNQAPVAPLKPSGRSYPAATAHQEHHAQRRNGGDGPDGGRGALAPPPNRPRQVAVGSLWPARERILAALELAQRPLSRADLGVLAVLSSKGGTFKTYLPQLLREGMVAEADGARTLLITDTGRQALPKAAVEIASADADELRGNWKEQLSPGGQRLIFDALVAAFPEWRTRTEVGAASGVAATGGTFKTYFPKISRLGLIEQDRGGQVRLHPFLFNP
jgi:hypothetical protein